MAELTPADVQTYTGGRLAAADAETIRMLQAALAIARREVGWHVSPVQSDEITLDGPDSRILWLPTLKVVELQSVIENDVELDVETKIRISAGDGPGLPRRVALRKRSGGFWTCEYSGLVISMEHGFTEEEAADWRQAVLSMVDQMSLMPVKASTGVSSFGQTRKEVDDVVYGWQPYASMAEEVAFSMSSIFDDYRLPVLEYF